MDRTTPSPPLRRPASAAVALLVLLAACIGAAVTARGQVQPGITSPAPGSTLPGTTVTFAWNPTEGALEYWLEVGTTPGGASLYNASIGTALSAEVTGLPTGGAPVYARLSVHTGTGWQNADYTFTAAPTPAQATITTPAPGSQLPGTAVTFAWTAGEGVLEYWLEVGTTPGGANLYNASTGTALSAAVTGLPTGGGPVHARLSSRRVSGWQNADFVFTAAPAPALAAITSPAPGTVLPGRNVTFAWSPGGGALEYWLEVGTAPGSANLFNASTGTALSAQVTGIPTGGAPVYARLSTRFASGWQNAGYTFTGPLGEVKAIVTSPTPGGLLPGTAATFAWTAGNEALEYWLEVGTAPGRADVYNRSTGTSLSAAVAGLPLGSPGLPPVGPATGAFPIGVPEDDLLEQPVPVHVRLSTRFASGWQNNSYTFSAAPGNVKAHITSPPPGSTLTGEPVTFVWTTGNNALQYWLEVGTTPGGAQLYNASPGTAVSAEVAGIPAGVPIYVRLSTRFDLGWSYTDYIYSPTPQQAGRLLARQVGLESLRSIITGAAPLPPEVAAIPTQPLLLNPGRVPLPANLDEFLNAANPSARLAAAQLGKALFWDQAVGSDGQACASCHFHAGVDNRLKNQLNPNITRVEALRQGGIIGYHAARSAGDTEFQLVGGGRGPNYALKTTDFPFVKDLGAGDAHGRNVLPATANGIPTLGPAPGNTNDTAASQGVFFTRFDAVDPDPSVATGVENLYDPTALGSAPVQLRDKGAPLSDPAHFQVASATGYFAGKANVRRVEPRNTPTMINAVFNLHNFWDGRANVDFNGVTPFGGTDAAARIYVNAGGTLAAQPVQLRFASLASQAVGPPLSDFEMSFGGRSFPDIGKKVLDRLVLEAQQVAPDDSLLGSLLSSRGAAPSGKGINVSYRTLIQQAFHPRLWNFAEALSFPNATLTETAPNSPLQRLGAARVQTGGATRPGGGLTAPKAGATLAVGPTYSQMEANFSFFFGIALMLYQAELVADQSKFDLFMQDAAVFTDQELAGLQVFAGKGRCVGCHGGPEMSNATIRQARGAVEVVEAMVMGNQQPAFYDNGFYNVGVTPTAEDLGRGGTGPGGKPLASSRQLLFAALGIDSIDFTVIGAPSAGLTPVGPEFVGGVCQQPLLQSFDPAANVVIDVCRDLNCDRRCDFADVFVFERVAVDGAFKTPQLRNVELTGPYFHNGGAHTLMQAVEFYDDGGNFCNLNLDDLDPGIQPLGLTPGEREGLVAFLLALTDERVRTKSAPFDHPELRIPNGHATDEFDVGGDPLFVSAQAAEGALTLPAVGAGGVAPADRLQPFHLGLDPGLTHFHSAAPANAPCRRPQPAP
jgi:cytochrome c peroxidase